MKNYTKTSVQLDPNIVANLLEDYPGLTIFEIVRFSLRFVAEIKPTYRPAQEAGFVLGAQDNAS